MTEHQDVAAGAVLLPHRGVATGAKELLASAVDTARWKLPLLLRFLLAASHVIA